MLLDVRETAVTAPNPPRGAEGWQLKLLQTWGETEKAQALLDSLNAFNVAFGGAPFTMPEAFVGPMEGLTVCPASAPKHIGKGRFQVAA